ncbi:MAG: hypothetical protein ACFB2Y_12185 [Fulvivirga sp.]
MSNYNDALNAVMSGDNVYVHTAQILVKCLIERAPELKDVNIYHLHTEGNQRKESQLYSYFPR